MFFFPLGFFEKSFVCKNATKHENHQFCKFCCLLFLNLFHNSNNLCLFPNTTAGTSASNMDDSSEDDLVLLDWTAPMNANLDIDFTFSLERQLADMGSMIWSWQQGPKIRVIGRRREKMPLRQYFSFSYFRTKRL